MEVGIGPGDIVLHGDPAPPLPKKGAQQPHPTFRSKPIVAKRSPISATAELLYKFAGVLKHVIFWIFLKCVK